MAIQTAGEDLYTFDDAVKPNTGSFYVRQIVGSTNYAMGTDAIDFSHGWLNYQVRFPISKRKIVLQLNSCDIVHRFSSVSLSI